MTNFPFDRFLQLDKVPETFVPPVSPEPVATKIQMNSPTPQLSRSEFSRAELETLTKDFLTNLQTIVDPVRFNTMFSVHFTVSDIRAEHIEFSVTTGFYKNMIDQHYQKEIKEAIRMTMRREDLNFSVQVIGADTKSSLSSNSTNILKTLTPTKSVKNTSFILEEELKPTQADMQKAIDSKIIEHESQTHSHSIDSTKTFDNFLVGPSNHIARASSLAVAKEPGKTYNVLFIYGNSGLGKTHLIHAIANHVIANHPSMRICMTSANRFMDDMVAAIQGNNLFSFRKQYSQNTDVLIIDDIHTLSHKVGTQEQFFHLFNELTGLNKQIVFTSDKPPKEIEGIEDRIRTRLSKALVVDIQQPDLETRIAILKSKAIEQDLYISDEVVTLIAKCVRNSIRELEGCLIQLRAMTSMFDYHIDLEMAKNILKLDEELENTRHITFDSIAKTVAKAFNVPIGDIKGASRQKEVVLPRQAAMYLMYRLLKPTYKDIGHFFGRDHTTAIHSIDAIQKKLKLDMPFSQKLHDIEKTL
jgi:chromosomal replication initiator protein